MKKKIKELTNEDIPKCWDKLFSLKEGLVVLFAKDLENFDSAKSTLPDSLLEEEVDVED